MAAALYWARAARRGRWGTLALTVLIIAVAGAVPIAGAAGARRTASVVDRTTEELAAPNVQVQMEGMAASELAVITEHPSVETAGRFAVVFGRPEGTDLLPFVEFVTSASVDGVWAYDVSTPRVAEGRLPARDEPHEVFVSSRLLDALDLDVGDRIGFETITMDSLFETFASGGFPPLDGPLIDLEIVGTGAMPVELVTPTQFGDGTMLFGPAFLAEHGDVVAQFSDHVDVRLAPGADLDGYVGDLRAALGERVLVSSIEQELDRLRDAIGIQRTALLLFLAVATIASAFAIAQVTTRSAETVEKVVPTLEALGLSSRARIVGAVVMAAPAAIAGTVLAVIGAYTASGWIPFGIARRLDPIQGRSADVVVLVVGGGIVLAGSLGAVAAATALAEHRRRTGGGRRRRPLISRAVAEMPPPTATGVRWALVRGRARAATPARAALAGTAVAVAGTAGAAVFAASLDRLLDTPARYGVTYDLEVAATGDEAPDEEAIPASREFAQRDEVDAATFVRVTKVTINGDTHDVFGIEPIVGDIGFTIVDGRAPAAADEVVLGRAVMDELGVSVGDEVTLPGGSSPLTVVGQAAFPPQDDPSSLATGLGLTHAGLVALMEDLGPERIGSGFPQMMVELADGVDVEEQSSRYVDEYGFSRVGFRPAPIEHLADVRGVPALVAIFLGALGVLALTHTIVVSASRRRTDLAVLRCVGFLRRDLRTTAVTHVLTTVAVGAIVGLPLGVVAGSTAWRRVADGTGVATDVDGVALAVLLVLAGAGVLTVALAIPWARSAARTRPAETLRSE